MSLSETPWVAEGIMDLDRFEEYLMNLKSVGCVRVDSVLNELDYGGSEVGQFGALSIDILHSLLGGIIKQMINCFMKGLPSEVKETFEEVADRIFMDQRNSISSSLAIRSSVIDDCLPSRKRQY